MAQFFTLSYYFNPNPGPSFKYWLVMLIFAGVLFVTGVMVKAYRNKTEDRILKKMIKNYPMKFFWFSVVAAVMTLIRLEGITLFSMRFLWIVYFGIMIYIVVGDVKRFYREYPRKVKQSLSHQKQNKYLPNKKKKAKKK